MLSKKTKIVATLGPSIDGETTILQLVRAGVNVFRINFSHADYKVVSKKIEAVRKINEDYGYNVAIIADLQGPKLRIGEVKEGSELKEGAEFTLVTKDPFVGNSDRAFIEYEQLAKDVKPGENILINDGKLMVEVISTNHEDEVCTKVIQGGPLSSRKGVNLPNTDISLPALTKKDRQDAEFALEKNVDWLALSFVRKVQDVEDLRMLITKKHKNTPIIVKIEKVEAIENLDAIIDATDGVMVARGDLGVELPAEDVPIIQKEIISCSRRHKKPVIVATHMMESMIENMSPTRAEVNDVANSVLDGADAVMLSAETSVGKHPLIVVQKMAKIIKKIESADLYNNRNQMNKPSVKNERHLSDFLCYEAARLSRNLDARAIVTFTHSGYTGFEISSQRPKAYVIVFTSNRDIINRLSLLWGVHCFYYDSEESTDDTIKSVNEIVKQQRIIHDGDFVINLTSMPVKQKGFVNTMRVSLA